MPSVITFTRSIKRHNECRMPGNDLPSCLAPPSALLYVNGQKKSDIYATVNSGIDVMYQGIIDGLLQSSENFMNECKSHEG